MSMIKTENICTNFGSLHVLKNVSLEVMPSEVVCIIGPSGAGKSTFLRTLNHLEHIDNGKIWVQGQLLDEYENGECKYKIPKKERNSILLEMGMVFQRFNLFPHKTVLQNVMLAPVNVGKIEKESARQKSMELLKMVGLDTKANEYPNRLSGGQQQRVAIARALVMQPDILCFDEPTSALDPELTGEVLKVIRELKDTNTTMIIVTHEMNFAKSVSDKVIFLSDGIIEEEGTPEQVFENPSSPKTKSFLAKSLENI